jgi:integrase
MTYNIHLGLPQFAHLRAVAEGVDPLAAAQRYLGPDTRHAAMSMHQALVDRARALARQSGQGAWRLIGVSLSAAAGAVDPAAVVPTIDDWISAQGYDGFRQADLIDLYQAAYPPDRKRARNVRLREQVLALLRELEKLHAVVASPADHIEDWFPGTVAKRLHDAGLWLLGELQSLIGQGGRWWRAMPATGPAKAARIAHYVAGLLPAAAHLPVPWQGRGVMPSSAPAPAFADWGGSRGDGVTRTGSDAEMIETWIRVRTLSTLTARSYRREARRLVLWASVERGKALAALDADDCAAYVAFLAAIPAAWIGRPAPLGNARWTPFARQLSAASRRQTHVIVKGFFEWGRRAGYLRVNPWEWVGMKVGDDATTAEGLLGTRAFTPAAWGAIMAYLGQADSNDPALVRARFVFSFCESTGLRARELLNATLGDCRCEAGRWYLLVQGKGAKARAVVLPSQALRALAAYLAARGLPEVEVSSQDPDRRGTPLLVSLLDPNVPLGYQAFYEALRVVVKQAIRASALPVAEQRRALAASPHWLRHTFGTRAVERGVSRSVLMQQFGHADERSTSRYSRAQFERVSAEMEAAFPAGVVEQGAPAAPAAA